MKFSTFRLGTVTLRALSLLTIFLFCFFIPSLAQVTKLDTIITIHMKALGGRNVLESIKTISSRGEMDISGTKIKCTCIYAFPNRVYKFSDFGGTEMITGSDGQTTWSIASGESLKVNDSHDIISTYDDLYIDGYLYLLKDSTYGRLELRNDTIIGGIRYYQLVMYPRGGDSLYTFINTVSGLMDYYISSREGKSFIAHLCDYRVVNGVKMPFHYEFTEASTGYSALLNIASNEINAPVPDSVFVVPSLCSQKQKYRFSEGFDSVVVNFKPNQRYVIFNGVVNGKRKCRFLLCTGSSGNVLMSQKMQKKLELHVSGNSEVQGVTGKGLVQFAEIDSIQIGNLIWYPGKIKVLGDKNAGSDIFKNHDAYVGHDFFMEFPIRIDFDKRQIIIFNKQKLDPPKPGLPVAVDLSSGLPRKEMSLDGRPIRTIINSGAPDEIFLLSNYRWLYKLADKYRFDPATIITYGVGGNRLLKVGDADSLRCDNTLILKPKIVIAHRPEGKQDKRWEEGEVGMGILSRYNLFIDYPHKLIYFDKRASTAE